MFSNLFINPYPIYNSMEDSKASFSNGAKGNLHWYWSLCCLMNKCFCITSLIISKVCVCVFLNLFLLLSLSKFCTMLEFTKQCRIWCMFIALVSYTPYELDEDLHIGAWINEWSRPMASCHWKMWILDYVCILTMLLECLLTSRLNVPILEINVIDTCDVNILWSFSLTFE
jgi:hypothetical protein